MSRRWPTISVVIPSVGRPELVRAIESVRRQDYEGDLELVVVFDIPEQSKRPEIAQIARQIDVVEFTGGGRKGGFARNRGVELASGDWIAFLDDDDEWHESKLSTQMQVGLHEKNVGKSPVVGCRVRQQVVGASEASAVTTIPLQLIQPAQSVEEYLFLRRRPGARRASFFTSTILTERTTCLDSPWDSSLPRHQDWDWLIRVGRSPKTSFKQVEDDLVTYYVGSAGSVSAGADWEPSYTWAGTALSHAARQVQVDFLAAQTLRYALQKRDWSGVRTILCRLIQLGRRPSFGPLLIAVAGLTPRPFMQTLMSKIR